jgi:ABC-type amino acid transport substrate-binding protein
MRELAKKEGGVSIYQTGTTIEREKQLTPIRIPLLKGTLGYRISLIHKDNIEKFDKIKSVSDLSEFTACQGTHWPDSDILEKAGLPVIRNPNYENMFSQLKNKRCDYFPRAIIEAYSEENARADPDIVVYDKLIISYPFPMYFFTSPHQKQLATDVEKGLSLAIKDGSFDTFFKNNTITKSLYPLSKWDHSRIIKLQNPLLPAKTPINNSSLWLFLKGTETH